MYNFSLFHIYFKNAERGILAMTCTPVLRLAIGKKTHVLSTTTKLEHSVTGKYQTSRLKCVYVYLTRNQKQHHSPPRLIFYCNWHNTEIGYKKSDWTKFKDAIQGACK